MLKIPKSAVSMDFGEVVFPKDGETVQPKRQAGLLAHLFKDKEDIGRVFLEPMSQEDLAWWNGDNTDDYGISLPDADADTSYPKHS